MFNNLHLLYLCIIIMVANASEGSKIRSDDKRFFLGCNWKCSIEDIKQVDETCDNLNRMWSSLSNVEKRKVDLCINPPYVFIDRVRQRLTKEISVGSQVRKRYIICLFRYIDAYLSLQNKNIYRMCLMHGVQTLVTPVR